MNKKLHSEAVDQLFEAILCLKNKEEFHRKFKEQIKRKHRQDLKDHKMGDNPDLLLDGSNRVYLRDVKTGFTMPVE